MAASKVEEQCVAGTPYKETYPECDYVKGYRPLISEAALHQVGCCCCC